MDLSYFNARIRGLMGRLLSPADYESLLKAEGFKPYYERLRSTAYGPYIEAASARFERDDEALSTALRLNLTDTFAILWKRPPEDAKVLLKSILSTWEIYNLKTVLRGLARGIRREDVAKTLVPAGEFDEAALNVLLGSKDVHDLVRFLFTWSSPYAAPVKKGIDRYLKSASLIEIELNLDKFIYGPVLNDLKDRPRDSRVIKDMLTLRIDLQNIMTLLKISGEGYSEEAVSGFFIDGGARLKKKEFVKMAGVSREGIIKWLIEAAAEKDIRQALEASDAREPGLLEERFEEAVRRRLSRLSVIEPLSIALPAFFIFTKVREIKNIRIIADAKTFGFPDPWLKDILFHL